MDSSKLVVNEKYFSNKLLKWVMFISTSRLCVALCCILAIFLAFEDYFKESYNVSWTCLRIRLSHNSAMLADVGGFVMEELPEILARLNLNRAYLLDSHSSLKWLHHGYNICAGSDQWGERRQVVVMIVRGRVGEMLDHLGVKVFFCPVSGA